MEDQKTCYKWHEALSRALLCIVGHLSYRQAGTMLDTESVEVARAGRSLWDGPRTRSPEWTESSPAIIYSSAELYALSSYCCPNSSFMYAEAGRNLVRAATSPR